MIHWCPKRYFIAFWSGNLGHFFQCKDTLELFVSSCMWSSNSIFIRFCILKGQKRRHYIALFSLETQHKGNLFCLLGNNNNKTFFMSKWVPTLEDGASQCFPQLTTTPNPTRTRKLWCFYHMYNILHVRGRWQREAQQSCSQACQTHTVDPPLWQLCWIIASVVSANTGSPSIDLSLITSSSPPCVNSHFLSKSSFCFQHK